MAPLGVPPAGMRVLPFRSNIPKIAEFSFDMIDPTYAARGQAGDYFGDVSREDILNILCP